MLTEFFHFEGNILLFIQDYLRTPFLTPVFQFITSLGNNGMIWIMITLVLLCFRKTRNVGILTAIALIMALLIDNILLKNIVARTRPYELIDGLRILVQKPKDYSFPSGHTGSSFAAAMVMYKALPKRYGVSAIILAALIGVSRLYIGIHYPSDVACGAVIGILIGMAVFKVYEHLTERTADSASLS